MGSDGKPVSYAVRNDEGAAGLSVEAGPVAECDGPHTDSGMEHELSAVSVSRKGECGLWKMIEDMRVMGKEDGERARDNLLGECGDAFCEGRVRCLEV